MAQLIADDAETIYAAEERAYIESRDRLVRQSDGEYVLIVGDRIIGVFRDPREAVDAGFRQFGLRPIFVRRIAAVDPLGEAFSTCVAGL